MPITSWVDFVNTVQHMRKWQNEFYTFFSPSAKNDCRRYEKEVDEFIDKKIKEWKAAEQERIASLQGTLFKEQV